MTAAPAVAELVSTSVVPAQTLSATSSTYPVGTPDASEPSGMAPPAADALLGYNQTYVNDFNVASLPAGWELFRGQAGGDPGSLWAPSHVTVSDGLLKLNTYRDSAYNDAWVDGGICQCDRSQTYGAYFVRSRTTGAGPTVVQLLWPANNSWPPEIDFNETDGLTSATSATTHYTSSNLSVESTLNIDMTKWHTFGVIWTPTSITYTVDGQVWGTDSLVASIPNIPMTLDLDQQTWCDSGYACPNVPVSELVDWVAEYTEAPAHSPVVAAVPTVTRKGPTTGSSDAGAVMAVASPSVILLPGFAALLLGAMAAVSRRRRSAMVHRPARRAVSR